MDVEVWMRGQHVSARLGMASAAPHTTSPISSHLNPFGSKNQRLRFEPAWCSSHS